MKIEQAISEERIVDFVVHPALLQDLVDWLDDRGLLLIPGPPKDEDDLWYIASPKVWPVQDRLRAWVQFYDLGLKMWLDVDCLAWDEAVAWVSHAPGIRRIKP